MQWESKEIEILRHLRDYGLIKWPSQPTLRSSCLSRVIDREATTLSIHPYLQSLFVVAILERWTSDEPFYDIVRFCLLVTYARYSWLGFYL